MALFLSPVMTLNITMNFHGDRSIKFHNQGGHLFHIHIAITNPIVNKSANLGFYLVHFAFRDNHFHRAYRLQTNFETEFIRKTKQKWI